MNANLAAVLYLVSGVLFILALRGLSSPETSRRGNTFGMVGMTIAVLTTPRATMTAPMIAYTATNDVVSIAATRPNPSPATHSSSNHSPVFRARLNLTPAGTNNWFNRWLPHRQR